MYYQPVDKITNLIRNNQIEGPDGALVKFKEELPNFKKLSRNPDGQMHYKIIGSLMNFGNDLRFKPNSINHSIGFLSLIDNEISITENKLEIEVLYLLRLTLSSIVETVDKNLKFLEKTNSEFPFNTTFKSYYIRALEKRRLFFEALPIVEELTKLLPGNEIELKIKVKYFNQLLSQHKLLEAEKLLAELRNNKTFSHKEILEDLDLRLDDHRVLEIKMNEMQEKVEQIFEKERSRIIEVLGVFSAIVAFILINTTLGKNFNLNEALIFNFSLACTLLIFSISLSYIFKQSRLIFYKEGRFWILLILLTLLFLNILAFNSLPSFIY